MRVRCSACSKPFEAQRSTARFCGATCRKRGSRDASESLKNAPEPANLAPVAPISPKEPPLVTVTRRELEEAEKLDTVIGQQAMRLAEKLCSGFDTGSATAAVSKEFRAVMAEALADVTKQADGIDELMARRLQRASGG